MLTLLVMGDNDNDHTRYFNTYHLVSANKTLFLGGGGD